MRTVFLALIYAVLTVILLILIIIFLPFGFREPLLGLSRWAMGLGLRVLGIQVEVSGREAIDRRSRYIFMANHLSLIDGPMLFRLIPHSVRVILKKSIFRIPVIGQAMRFVGFVPVDRKGIRGGKKSIEKAARLIRERGYSYLIFPEGTRSRDGLIQAFRRGGFFLALESGTAIAPISIKGTFELMPKGRLFADSGKVDVRFHPAIPVEGYNLDNMKDLIERVKKTIELGLREGSGAGATPDAVNPLPGRFS
jgi:1-acyl-sn-glycerol-3-phosphate acyltransferase